jgi:hypothetical protein
MQKQAAVTTKDVPAYINESQFCARYGITPRTAQRWRVTGDGPPWCRLGLRRVLYRLADCEEWAKYRTFAHRAAEIENRIRAA